MAILLHRKEGIGKSRAMAVIMLDRLFDVMALVALLAFSAFFQDFPRWIEMILVAGLVGSTGGLAVIWLMVSNQTRSIELAFRVLQFLPEGIRERIMQILTMMLQGVFL